jgi:hypothetical protein
MIWRDRTTHVTAFWRATLTALFVSASGLWRYGQVSTESRRAGRRVCRFGVLAGVGECLLIICSVRPRRP